MLVFTNTNSWRSIPLSLHTTVLHTFWIFFYLAKCVWRDYRFYQFYPNNFVSPFKPKQLIFNPKANKLSGPMLKSALVVKATTVVLWFLRPITGARERSVYHWGAILRPGYFVPQYNTSINWEPFRISSTISMRIRNKRHHVGEGRACPSRPTCMASKTGYKGVHPNFCFYFSVR